MNQVVRISYFLKSFSSLGQPTSPANMPCSAISQSQERTENFGLPARYPLASLLRHTTQAWRTLSVKQPNTAHLNPPPGHSVHIYSDTGVTSVHVRGSVNLLALT